MSACLDNRLGKFYEKGEGTKADQILKSEYEALKNYDVFVNVRIYMKCLFFESGRSGSAFFSFLSRMLRE